MAVSKGAIVKIGLQ